MYQNYGFQVPGSILGFAIEEYDSPCNYSVYVEGSMQEGYCERYPESSAGLTEEEFNAMVSVSSLYHELGHVLDWNGTCSNTEEFINIYNNDINGFTQTREYTINNFNEFTNIGTSSEYFATAFSCYFNYPDDLMTYCPDTYNYFSYLINNVFTSAIICDDGYEVEDGYEEGYEIEDGFIFE